MICLFGVRYAPDIRDAALISEEIVRLAKLGETYVTEVNKSIRLAPYVRGRDGVLEGGTLCPKE